MATISRRSKMSQLVVAASAIVVSVASPALAQDPDGAGAASEPNAATSQPPADAAGAAATTDETLTPEDAAVGFVEELIDEATLALTDETADEAVRIQGFQAVLADGLALNTLAKFMVSKGVYEKMSDDQRARYDAVFDDYITLQYAEQFDGILGNDLEVTDTKSFRRDIFVRTQFVRSEGGPIKVDWRTRALNSGGHKLVDIVVNGASIMSVKKSEFSSFISKQGVDALIERLEADVAAAGPSPTQGDGEADDEPAADEAPPTTDDA